jgi:ABC-type glycerol-3-phosphate transport system substrate-binding protein
MEQQSATEPAAQSGRPEQSGQGGALTRRREVLLRIGAAASAGGLSGFGVAIAAACAPSKQGEVPAPSAREVTLTYFTDWSGGTRAEWVKTALPRFTQEHPKITVQVEFAQGDAKEAALANAAAGTLSDVMLGGGDTPHFLAKAGALADVTPILKSLRFKMEDIVWIPSTISVKGKQYGLPFQWNYWTRVINQTLFRQAGVPLPTEKTTWPQLAEAMQKIAKPDQDLWGIETGTSIWHWFPTVWAYGGEAISNDQKKTLLDQPAPIEALQFYVDIMHRQRVATPMDEKGAIPATARFASGNVAVSHANAPGRGLDAQIAGKFDWDVIYLPLGPRTGRRFVFVSEQPNIVTTTAVRKGQLEQAVQLIIWACSSKTAQELILDIGTNSWPTSKAVLNSPKYLAGPPASVKIMVDMIKDFKDPQIFQGWIEWRTALSNALNPAFAGKQSVQVAAREAVRAGDLVLAKYAS